MAFQVGGAGKGARPEINVTPLVDVCLVLLIIFMLITPMLQRGAAVQMPTATHVAKKARPENILVSVDLDKNYWIESVKVPEANLEAEFRKAVSAKPGLPVLIKADKRLTCGPVRKAIAAVNKVGVHGASLAAQLPPGMAQPAD